MTRPLNILVFPCGSEIGLEIHRSLKYSKHINLIGGSSVEDHGKFVYNNYIQDIPFYNDAFFVDYIKMIVERHNIDAIFPTMDAVITKLSSIENELFCKIIGSPLFTNEICLSKTKTYKILKDVIPIPLIYSNLNDVQIYPVFLKPDIGYGGLGTKLINNYKEGIEHLSKYPNCIILDNLPGQEYTIDCFTDKDRNLLFSEPRIRKRIKNGISVNTSHIKKYRNKFIDFANLINDNIIFRGAWFFQMKENINGDFHLLEVASRLGGSSSLFRNIGVNFALLSIFDAFNYKIDIFCNNYEIVMDRSLNCKFKINIEFDHVYIDFDDCLIINNKVNTTLLALIYQFINNDKKVVLITKHRMDISQTLKLYRLDGVFDKIIHLNKAQFKYQFINKYKSIFIDDSHSERMEVHNKLGIPVFSPDSIECLFN